MYEDREQTLVLPEDTRRDLSFRARQDLFRLAVSHRVRLGYKTLLPSFLRKV